MGKTWLSVITALLLVAGSAGFHLARRYSAGADPESPRGDSAWKITLVATGELMTRDATLVTPRPLDFRHQHVFHEEFQSKELTTHQHGKKNSEHREAIWRQANMKPSQSFRLAYSFRCLIGVRRPSPAMKRLSQEIDGAPGETTALKAAARIESHVKEIAAKAAELADPRLAAEDQVKAFFDYVDQLDAEPTLGARTALECLLAGRGDSGGKSRLLVALCRNRGIPARLLSGLVLAGNQEQGLHQWAEAWVSGTWLPMCPTHHHFGTHKFPKNYLVLHVGDEDLVRAHGAQFQSGFTTQELQHPLASDEEQPLSAARIFWQQISLYGMRPGEQHVVKFLLLLPLAALIVSIWRTLIGMTTFGTFSPALIGVAFLDLKALPWGLGIFVVTVLVGWAMRHLIERYHLLLVPRTAVLLTLIVLFLILLIMTGSHYGVATTQYISLFPLVILTHLVERFWMVESEEGAATSFKTLLGTLLVAVSISVALSPDAVSAWMFRYPETLGVVLAAQFLIGRYTGYRLSELYRFRPLIQDEHWPGGTA